MYDTYIQDTHIHTWICNITHLSMRSSEMMRNEDPSNGHPSRQHQ
jgi:hypothetical protein